MSKLDILTHSWIDIVFEGRNKQYGAYDLRKNNAKNTTKAILIGGLLFIAAFATPMVLKYLERTDADDVVLNPTLIEQEVVLASPPPVDETIPPPPPAVEPPPPRVDQVRFPPPVVKPDDKVVEAEPPTVEDLKTATTGKETLKGDPNSIVQIEEPNYGKGPIQEITETAPDEIFTSVEEFPSFPGGMEKFYGFLRKELVYPPIPRENGTQGRVVVSFVVEKDGSLTDIKIARGVSGIGGDDLGAEAIRILKRSPKWTPGKQNGRPVRVAYNMPISFTLQQ